MDLISDTDSDSVSDSGSETDDGDDDPFTQLEALMGGLQAGWSSPK